MKKEVNFNKALVKKSTNEVLFYILNCKDIEEQKGHLACQIYKMLIELSNKYDNYQKAIEEIQGYLKAFIFL